MLLPEVSQISKLFRCLKKHLIADGQRNHLGKYCPGMDWGTLSDKCLEFVDMPLDMMVAYKVEDTSVLRIVLESILEDIEQQDKVKDIL